VEAAEWLSAGALLGLLALVLWRTGAAPRHVALILAVVALGIVATAAVWDYLESHE
jgi:uncharacterized membrane protein YqjE